MAEAPPVLIAGGGIGGLALAVALARAGRRSQVLEQRGAFDAVGAGIQLGPNGVRALERLGLAAALSACVGVPAAIRVVVGRSGRRLTELPLGSWIAARHGAPYWVAHRADLHRALLSAAAAEPLITLRTGFTLASITADGSVRARSTAGATATGSALVGADGLWSRVRELICPGNTPRYAGATACRAVIPAAAAGALAGPHVGLWLTPGVHVVHYPVRAGAEVAVVVIAGAQPAITQQTRQWDVAVAPATVLGRLRRFHPSLTEVLAAVPDWRQWALYRAPTLPAWSRGPVALIGDAAHPMLPYLAQGGALALEDALVLAGCLREARGGALAFRTFEALRRRRAERVQQASVWQGRIYHLPPPFSLGRDCLLTMLPAPRVMARFDWLYGWPAG